jgi:hypothetical protein
MYIQHIQGLCQSRLSTADYKLLTVGDKVNICILTQVYAHVGIHFEQASCLRLSVPTVNLTVKNQEELKESL